MSDVAITGFGAVRAPNLEVLPEPLRARASRAERVTQLAFSAGGPALAMAGLAATDGDPRPRLGIVLGTAFGCFVTNAAFERRFAEGGPAAASPRLFAATVSNAPAGELAIAYRLGGPAVTLTAGGVAGLVAIGHAVDLLRAGQADVLVAGGMDAAGEALDRWIEAGGLEFDGRPGEGAAFVVLERREHAERRDARTLGTVCGFAAGFEAGPLDDQTLPGVMMTALVEAGYSESSPPRSLISTWARSWSSNAEGSFVGVTEKDPPDRGRTADRLGTPSGGAFSVTGVAAMLATLEQLRAGHVGVIGDRCSSGHVAAIVVRKDA